MVRTDGESIRRREKRDAVNYYEVLGVWRDVSLDEVERRVELLRERIGEKVAGEVPGAAEQLARIETAYAVLSDPSRRAEYDLSLAGHSEERQASLGAGNEPVSTPPLTRSAHGGKRGYWIALAVLVGALGFGATWPLWHHDGGDVYRYPAVLRPQVIYGPAVTEASGAVVQMPLKPSSYVATPSPSCERDILIHSNGSRSWMVVPPAPGLRARALSARRVKLSWWFTSRPGDCRPARVELLIDANDVPGSSPRGMTVPVVGDSGSSTLTYPNFLPPPDVALAYSYSADGRRSSPARRLIAR